MYQAWFLSPLRSPAGGDGGGGDRGGWECETLKCAGVGRASLWSPLRGAHIPEWIIQPSAMSPIRQQRAACPAKATRTPHPHATLRKEKS